MNVAVVTHRVVKGDGQGRVNYEIVRELIANGHRVFIVASEVSPEIRKGSLVEAVVIDVSKWPTELLRNQIFAIKSALWLTRYRRKLDVVHVNGFITWYIADVNTVHFVHTSWIRSPFHTFRVRKDLYGLYQWVYTATNSVFEKVIYKKMSRKIVAVSNQVRSEMLNLGVSEKNIAVIANGVDLREFSPGDSNRTRLGLPVDPPMALFVGDVKTPRKNLDTVLHALKFVPELHLAVVGSVDRSPFPDLAKKLGLADRVHFLGFHRDVTSVMRSADLFVFPSRYEPFGLVVLEALACGLPVVTCAGTGAAEIISPKCGVVLPETDDSLALANAISELIIDPERLLVMARAARAVAECYSWNLMATKYIDLYRGLVNDGRK